MTFRAATLALALAGNVDFGSFDRPPAQMQVVPHNLHATPSALFLWSVSRPTGAYADLYSFAIGVTDGTTSRTVMSSDRFGLAFSGALSDGVIASMDPADGGRWRTRADLVSWDAASFTLHWTDAVNPDADHIFFLAFSGVEAKVFEWALPPDGGVFTVQEPGFDADVVFLLNAGDETAAIGPNAAFQGGLGLGAATSASDQFAWGLIGYAAADLSPLSQGQSGQALIAVALAGTTDVDSATLAVSSYGSTLQLAVSRARPNPGITVGLALKGIDVRVGSFTVQQADIPLGVTPDAVLLTSSGGADSTTPAQRLQIPLGAATATTQGTIGLAYQNVQTSSARVLLFPTNKMLPSTDAECAFAGFYDGGMTLSCPKPPPVTTPIDYVAFVNRPDLDAGVPDAGTFDAGSPDAGAPDAGGVRRSDRVTCGCQAAGPCLLPVLLLRRRRPR
jgi:hypothetical protein